MPRSSPFVPALLLALAVPAAAQAPTPLPLTGSAQGTVADEATEYTLTAKSAGVLTVAVQGTGDLALQLVDEDGQVLPDGTADRDMNGNEGTELLSARLTEAGAYRVRVRLQGGSSATFTIAATYLAFPAFQRAGDPDRRPALAKAAPVGKPLDDALDPENGDVWDWFVLKPTQDGTLTVVTRPSGQGDPPDLQLEIFTDGKFSEPADRSDQDMQSNSANESVSVNVRAGQAVHVKVTSNFSRGGRYRLSSSLAP
jgi:hypothetical protein